MREGMTVNTFQHHVLLESYCQSAFIYYACVLNSLMCTGLGGSAYLPSSVTTISGNRFNISWFLRKNLHLTLS